VNLSDRVKHGHVGCGDRTIQFEFLLNTEPTRVLMAPISEDPELEKREVEFAQQKIRVRGLSQGVRFAKKKGKKEQPLLLVLALLACAAYVFPDEARPLLNEYGLGFLADFLPEGTQPKKTASGKSPGKKDKDGEGRAVASYEASGVAPEVAKTAEQYYRQGFREYRAGHYLRARESFSLALQVNPAHHRARFYLDSAITENDNEIKRLIASGKTAKEVGRFREARGYFETALRRLGQDEENPDYTECVEALKTLNEGVKE
jgi:tetratricopeptide (TPR) repeat protein